jgi:cyanophycinase
MKFFIKLISITLLSLIPAIVCSQGKIMLVGGGSETNGGWSDLPYGRMVEEAANKKVAVIDYQSGASQWLPDYFESFGAESAINIMIDSRELADTQQMYDSLMQFDAIFFRGGNQNRYYQYYKDTKTHQAIMDKYQEGGVLGGTSAGMAIMSGVMFTSANGSTTPFDGLENLESNFFNALENDFLPFYPGYIFDTHFIERGRIPRLMAFQAWWQINREEPLTGIGVDDRTAFFIDADGLGTVYGTAAIAIYQGNFSAVNRRMSGTDIQAIQLLHGHQYHLLTHEIINGPQTFFSSTIKSETGNYRILLGGGGNVARNQSLINHLASLATTNDSILVVSRANSSLANQIVSRLTDVNAASRMVHLSIQPANNSADSTVLRNHIRRTTKVIFADTNPAQLMSFIHGGATGELLYQHLRRDGMITAFALQDAALSGKVYAANVFNNASNAYNGNLSYAEGLNLLQSTIVLPDAFSPGNNDFYENLSSAGIWGTFTQDVRYALYLTEDSFVEFAQQESENTLTAFGRYSALLSDVDVSNYDRTTQFAGSNRLRNQVAFDYKHYHILAPGESWVVGTAEAANSQPYEFEEEPQEVVLSAHNTKVIEPLIYPNPARELVHVQAADIKHVRILSMQARELIVTKQTRVDVTSLSPGIYFMEIHRNDGEIFVKKLMIK